jgi:RimJ/RimL family protein N-acetyltransferase
MADLDFVAAMLADPEVMRYWPSCCTRDEAADWIRKQQDRYATHGYGYWLVLLKESGQPVGQVGLVPTEIDRVEETALGYMIHRPFWRRGYGFESAAASRDYAFDVLGKQRLVAPIRPENFPSQALARKLGMKPGRQILCAGLEHVVFSLSRQSPER